MEGPKNEDGNESWMTRRAEPANSASRAERHGTVAAGFVTGMVAGLRRAGRRPEPLLAAVGIDAAVLRDPAARVGLQAYADLYNLINRELDDEAFGLFPAPLRCGSFEFLCRGAVTAPTLAAALERAARFLRLVLPDLAVGVSRDRAGASLVIAETRPLAPAAADPARVFAFEWLLRLLHGLACWLVGRGLALDSVAFPYPRPPHADDYALIYTARSEFDAERLVARFQANLLDLPVRRDEAALVAFLAGAPGRLVMLYRRDRETVQRVRDRLRAALPANPTLADLAGQLHLSPRTLHRRLAEEGSNFRSIKEALRRDLALTRLAQSRIGVAQLAADLGYADTSAFYRACVEWTGMAPSDYRARLAGANPPEKMPAASGKGT